MTTYRHDTVRDGSGYRYRIFDQAERLRLTSGVFASERDAESVGRHFSSDPDLGEYLKDLP